MSNISNWLVALSALGAFITGALSYWKTRKNAATLKVIHVLVNQRLSDTVFRVDQLSDVLRRANINVPPEEATRKAATHDR